jgi:hypothetical protein
MINLIDPHTLHSRCPSTAAYQDSSLIYGVDVLFENGSYERMEIGSLQPELSIMDYYLSVKNS